MYEEYLVMLARLDLVKFVIGFVIILIVILGLVQIRKTKQYRRELGDLYVAGKIRKIASNESIN